MSKLTTTICNGNRESYLSNFEFPQRINIHFDVIGNLWHHSSAVNEDILNMTKSVISFPASSIQKLHVTLLIAYCDTVRDLESVLCELALQIRNMLPVKVSIGKPYIKKPDNNYVFSDVLPSGPILSIKKSLWKSLSSYLRPLDWDVINEPPHITLAYINENYSNIETYLAESKPLGDTVFISISVSFSGEYGTCLGTIKTYYMKDA